jgi:hypothetical protein
MPQVPVYGGPQVAADPLRPVQARALDVSSGTRAIGQGLANLGEGIDRYAEREAQAQAFNAEDTLTKEWLTWDSQARKHYVGEKATEYEAAAAEWWAKAPETVGTTLNPRARELVGRSLAQKRNSAMASVMTAAGAEKERHADQVALADIDSTLQFGVTTGNVDAARMQIQEKVSALGARKGWSTELVQKAQGEYLSQMHMAQIDTLPAEAGLAYFREHRDEIDFDKQGRTEKYLERSIEVEQKQREADAEKATRDAEERLTDSAWSLYAQRQPVPQSVITALPGRTAVQLLDAIEARAAREAKGEVVRTDPAEYNRVMLDITEGRRVDLRPYSERFESADMDRLVKLQQDMATPDKVPEVATLTQQLNTFTTGFNDEKKKQFTDAVQTEISRQQQAKGRTLTFEERRAVMDAQYMEGEVLSGKWYSADSDKRLYELTPTERANWVPDEIPAEQKAQVIEALKLAGIAAPTDAQIIQRYKRAMGIQ